MKSLQESILSNMNEELVLANSAARKVSAFGNKLELHNVYGDSNTALWGINTSELSKAVKKLKPYSKNIDDIIDNYRKEYGRYSMLDGSMYIHPNVKTNIESFVTYVENIILSADYTDFNDVNTKESFLSELNDMMHNAGLIDKKSKIFFEKSYGGDKKGLFQISLEYNFESIVFVYNIK
jgi:hypothetical protein